MTTTEHSEQLPTVLGYVRCHLLMTEVELADLKERIAHHARRRGYRLDRVYVERVETSPAAFYALMDAVVGNEVTAIVVPSLQHLAVLGDPTAMEIHLQRTTGARLVVAATPP